MNVVSFSKSCARSTNVSLEDSSREGVKLREHLEKLINRGYFEGIFTRKCVLSLTRLYQFKYT